MKKYLVFAALCAAFLCAATNSYAGTLKADRAERAAQAFTRWAGYERETGTVFRLRRCGPRCFHARVAWFAGTDEYNNAATGEHWLRRVYERETLTVKLRHGYAVVWSPFFGGWWVRGLG